MNNNDTALSSDYRQNQSTLSSFVGFKMSEKFRIAGEYNYQKQYQNVKDHDLFGYSFYATYTFNKKFEVFGRADKLISNKLEGEPETWNYEDNGVGVLGGFQYAPVKGLKLALNYRHVFPDQTNLAPPTPSTSWVYVNVEFKFN
jgi:hypothetical protein